MAKRLDIRMKLPPRVKDYIELSVELGVYPDAGACVADMYRRMSEPKSDADLEALALETIRSRKKAKRMTEKDREELHAFAQRAGDLSRKRKSVRRVA